MIPVNEPVLGGNEARYVQECLESGWIGNGRFITRFEEELKNGRTEREAMEKAVASAGDAARQMAPIVESGDISTRLPPT